MNLRALVMVGCGAACAVVVPLTAAAQDGEVVLTGLAAPASAQGSWGWGAATGAGASDLHPAEVPLAAALEALGDLLASTRCETDEFDPATGGVAPGYRVLEGTGDRAWEAADRFATRLAEAAGALEPGATAALPPGALARGPSLARLVRALSVYGAGRVVVGGAPEARPRPLVPSGAASVPVVSAAGPGLDEAAVADLAAVGRLFSLMAALARKNIERGTEGWRTSSWGRRDLKVMRTFPSFRLEAGGFLLAVLRLATVLDVLEPSGGTSSLPTEEVALLRGQLREHLAWGRAFALVVVPDGGGAPEGFRLFPDGILAQDGRLR